MAIAPNTAVLALLMALASAAVVTGRQQAGSPANEFDVRDVMIGARDGVHLHTRIFTPKNQREPLPMIMLRTPYGNANAAARFTSYMRGLADEGYIFVFQDIRGKYGSEGTFVIVLEAKMRLVDRPKHVALDVIHYRDIQEALECSQAILESGPYAVELTDKMILDLARGNIEQSKRMGFVQGDPAAILIVEYAGDTAEEVRAKVDALEARRQRERFGYAASVALDVREQGEIWKLRKAGLGLLFGTHGDAKPLAFVEDTAVPPKDLAKFVARFREIFARHEVDGAYYGHC